MKLKQIIFIFALFAGYIFASYLTHETTRKGIKCKDRIELTEIYNPFWKL